MKTLLLHDILKSTASVLKNSRTYSTFVASGRGSKKTRPQAITLLIGTIWNSCRSASLDSDRSDISDLFTCLPLRLHPTPTPCSLPPTPYPLSPTSYPVPPTTCHLPPTPYSLLPTPYPYSLPLTTPYLLLPPTPYLLLPTPYHLPPTI